MQDDWVWLVPEFLGLWKWAAMGLTQDWLANQIQICQWDHLSFDQMKLDLLRRRHKCIAHLKFLVNNLMWHWCSFTQPPMVHKGVKQFNKGLNSVCRTHIKTVHAQAEYNPNKDYNPSTANKLHYETWWEQGRKIQVPGWYSPTWVQLRLELIYAPLIA